MSSSKEIITFLAQSLDQPDVVKLLKTTSPKPRADSTKLIA
jgi:hypothetical protein